MWLFLLACFQRLEADPADTGVDGVDTGPADTDTDTDTDTGPPASESDCDDGRDDDDDGDVDCDDSDCADARACQEDTEPPEPEACHDDDLGSDLGWSVATTVPAGDDATASCGDAGRADVLLEWTTPATDTYVFDTVGSSVDTVLWVADDTCDGEELACSDDYFGDSSELRVDLRAGDVVVLGVEGSGAVQLNAWRGACADVTIGQETDVYGSSEGADTTFTTDCSGEEYGADVVLRWVAPSSGTWRVDTAGSEYDTILSVRESDCGAPELICNDDEDPDDFVYTSALELDAEAGTAYLVAVGGYSAYTGTFYLTFTPQ
jgi:hypothetical protein